MSEKGTRVIFVIFPKLIPIFRNMHAIVGIFPKTCIFFENCYNDAIGDEIVSLRKSQKSGYRMMLQHESTDFLTENLSAKEEADRTVECLFCIKCSEELALQISLYRIPIGKAAFYAVATQDAERIAAELIGTEYQTAESIYRRIVRGTVPPSTLHEVIFDLV